MNTKIRKAMVLAAGLGTRLRPLTYKIPKPLLPLGSNRLIDYCLHYLAKNQITEVMINLHHLGSMIREYVGDGSRYHLEISYSEEPEILGTGGGIKNCESFFGDSPFVGINADSLISADLKAVIERHFKTKAAATMVLKKKAPSDPYEGVEIDKDLFVKKVGGDGEHFYTGLQIISPELLRILPPAGTVSCLIKDGYQRFLEKGKKVGAFIYDGYFNDLGTPERYEQAKKDILSGALKSPLAPL